MKTDANDPRWTAYALGEIKDAGERAELEQTLQESEEIRLMVEEIRRTADLLNDSLKYESPAALTQAQRDRIESRATKRTGWIWSRPVWALSGVAAMLILTLSIWMVQSMKDGTGSRGPETLMTDLRTEEKVLVPDASDVGPLKMENEKRAPVSQTAPEAPLIAENAAASAVVSNSDARASRSDTPFSKGKTPNVELAPTSVTVQGTPVESEAASRKGEHAAPPVLAAEKKPELKIPLRTAITSKVQALVQSTVSAAKEPSISGLVTDVAGGVLPGTDVTLTNLESGVEKAAMTDAAGAYSFPELKTGKYAVTAELEGFQKQAETGIQLAADTSMQLNFKLPIAEITEAIMVSTETESVLLESNPSVGQVLPETQANDLPLVNSNARDLIKVMGGVNMTPNEIWEADQTKLAGVSANQVDVQRDGVTVKDARYQEGLNSSSKLEPEQVAKMSLVAVPVGGELARGRGPYPPPPPPRPPIWPPERRMPPVPGERPNTESYENVVDNPFMETTQNPLSTFSIDVDTASYSNIRRFLEGDSLPPKDAVRIEELVNYFDYDYKGPDNEDPFAARFEMTEAPWNKEHRLLRIGIKAIDVDPKERPATNLVFLIDVSGSMGDRNKLPLVKDSLHMLVDQLTDNDHVAIVTYAGTTRVALSSTPGDEKWKIHRAIDYLRSGGSTNGASGIQLAYETARMNFIKGGANRVILATDGDFNVGITSHGELTRLIEEKAESGVFLSALGYGMGNYKDDTLEILADKGRGNYAYIDTIEEAKKVLVEQISATLVSVAKDVKIQVEFNPGRVGAYRLIGYEDRVMPKEDFNDDTKKAGVIGAGHAVTALYEIVPVGKPIPASGVDPLKYQKPLETTRAASSDETATVKIRYKEPEGDASRLLEFTVKDLDGKFGKASKDFRFAASVAAFGMVLRDSPYKGSATLEDALDWAKDGEGPDRHGYRAEFIRLIHRAISIKK